MSQPPVIFSQKAATSPKGSGYPIQISAADLDKNFTYATLDIPEEVQGRPQPFSVDTVTGPGGHSQRRLVFRPPAPSQDAVFSVSGGSLAWIQAPGGEKKVLSARNQQIEWSNAIQDGTQKGQMLKWNPDGNNWVLFSGGAEGNFPQWDATNGWESQGAGTSAGQLMKWNAATKNWGPGPSGTVDNELLKWNATSDTWEPFGRGATDGQLLVAQSGGWVPFSAPTSEKTVLTANGGNLSWEAAIPEPPSSGTHVLGAVGGTLQWIATEEC